MSTAEMLRKWEEEVLEYWQRNKIYERARERLKGRPLFRFLDGPPYPTGPIHLGHSWNKVLKDIILRYRRMRGFQVTDTPGYDMHGLPIEVQVEKKLGFKHKGDVLRFGVEKFVEECRRLAFTNVGIETRQFRRLGVWMDWERPYLTTEPSYIEGIWWAIKRMHEKGRLYRGWKVLGWCPRCQTVLAQHEYEYKQRSSPSLFFKVRLAGKENVYVAVWTTTPWTLIGNMAIALHPDEWYARVRLPDGEEWILAEARVKAGLLEQLGVERYEIVERFKGKELEGAKYEYPLLDEVPIHKQHEGRRWYHSIVMSSEYVTVEEGTGCLHVAPSFGPEDYDLGMKFGLPLIVFIDERGVFTEEGGIFKGMSTDEATARVVEILEQKGLVIKYGRITHEYPHCWRCKSPLIFRLTRQWFFKVKDLRDELVRHAEKTNWVPPWAKSLFIEWLRNLEDWCISRQRFWGTPLPIWVCERCGYYEVIGSAEELERKAGRRPADLHRPRIDEITYPCPKCGGTMRRVPDVIDVWVDSGSATWAVLPQLLGVKDYERWQPYDVILEGKDQIRGWFSALFVLAVALFGRVPFKTVYMHGFVTDEQGRAMHKSLGNVILPEEVIERGGAEILRFYQVSATSPGEDQRFGFTLLRRAQAYVNVIINTYRFLKQLAEYADETREGLAPEDRWLLSRVNTLIKEVTEMLERYDLPEYARALERFIVEDVSHFYIQLVRDRARPGAEAGKVLYALKYALERFLRLMAPLNPMLAEKVYLDVIKPLCNLEEESVHLLPWPSAEEELIDPELEELMERLRELIAACKRLRQEAGLKARWPCLAAYIEDRDGKLRKLEPLLVTALNVKEVIFERPPERPTIKIAETRHGLIGLDISETRELKAERLMRDVSRHVRAARKKLGLKPTDRVKLEIAADPELAELLKLALEQLKERVGAAEIAFVEKLTEEHGSLEFDGRRLAFRILPPRA